MRLSASTYESKYRTVQATCVSKHNPALSVTTPPNTNASLFCH
jgi:hypothetical protein